MTKDHKRPQMAKSTAFKPLRLPPSQRDSSWWFKSDFRGLVKEDKESKNIQA